MPEAHDHHPTILDRSILYHKDKLEHNPQTNDQALTRLKTWMNHVTGIAHDCYEDPIAGYRNHDTDKVEVHKFIRDIDVRWPTRYLRAYYLHWLH